MCQFTYACASMFVVLETHQLYFYKTDLVSVLGSTICMSYGAKLVLVIIKYKSFSSNIRMKLSSCRLLLFAKLIVKFTQIQPNILELVLVALPELL